MPTTSIKNAYCCTRKVSSKYIVEQNVMFIHYGAVPDWHGRMLRLFSFEVSCCLLPDAELAGGGGTRSLRIWGQTVLEITGLSML